MKLTTLVLTFFASFPHASPFQEKPAVPATSLAGERRELAEIQLLLGADRKYAEAKERLAKLAESLSGRSGTEAKTLLGRVEQLERTVRRALGEPVPDDLSLLIDVVTSQLGDKVDEAVLAALARNDYSFLSELGSRAGPGLAEAVRAHPDVLPGLVAEDPLLFLLRLDLPRADELLGEMLGHDGFFWKKRVVRALGEASPWNAKALFSTESPRRWLGAGIQQTLEKYAEDPDVGNAALVHLGSLSRAGAQSEVFRSLLAEGLRSSDPLRREAAKTVVKNGRSGTVRAILEDALADGDADLRTFASAQLSSDPESRVLLAHANDPEPEVRKQVLKRLERTDQLTWMQEEEQAVLARLLAEEENGVRKAAWKILSDLPLEIQYTTLAAEQTADGEPIELDRRVSTVSLPAEVYRSLSRRSEPEERAELASIVCRLPAPLCFELALSLAADPASEVLSALEKGLDDLPHWSDPDAMLRIASALLDNPARTWMERGNVDNELIALTATRAGLAALTRWIIARGDASLRNAIDGPSLAGVDPRLFADYVTWLFERDQLDWNKATSWPAPAMRFLAEDRTRPLVLRMLSLQSVCKRRIRWDDGLGTLVEQVLADPAWGGLDQEKWKGLEDSLHSLVSDLPGEPRNRAIAVLLDNSAFPEWLSVYSISAFDRRTAGAAAIGKRALERWFGRADAGNSAVRETIEAMASVPELRDDRVLAEATRRNAYAYAAWDTIASLKDPAFLPLIRAALEESGERKAAEALFGYLSDEAAELLLLAAARVPSTELRDQCLAHLEKIREYQDSRERWATRKVKTQTREQVLAQLVEQLASRSDDVKVQAIRALATWEAVEVMPKLIELTTSGSKPVAAAAREALDRLNAPRDAPKKD